jgi:hypothetical protein
VNRTRSFRNHFSETFAAATFEQIPDRKVEVSKLARLSCGIRKLTAPKPIAE